MCPIFLAREVQRGQVLEPPETLWDVSSEVVEHLDPCEGHGQRGATRSRGAQAIQGQSAHPPRGAHTVVQPAFEAVHCKQ